jgi:ADP-ribose pyrophosphatase YjhB (NUDIX family)
MMKNLNNLPFDEITVRAIIRRRKDGAILGALHRSDGKFALPGGSIKEGERWEDAILRELEEEGIRLIGNDTNWRNRLAVDYYQGYNQLSLWFIFVVDEVELNLSSELLQVEWISLDQDPWYPFLKDKLQLWIQQYLPDP